MSELLYLSRADVEALGVGIADVLAAVEAGFRLKGEGRTEMPPKPGIHPRPNAFIHAMPAYVEGVEAAGLKWVSGYPGNPAEGLPYISGLLILNDPATGLPIAVMDCAWITAMRTGASVGVAARHLAPPNSRVVAIVGTGVQARPSLAALAEVLPSLNEVRCYDLLPAARDAFIAEMSAAFPGLQFTICQSAREACQRAQVVVSAIPIVTQPDPPLDAGMLEEGGLAVSLDYDSAWSTAAMAECDRFVCDDEPQLTYTKAHGVYFRHIPRVHGDLGQVCAGRLRVREHDKQRIFAMNMGIATHDMVTAKLLYEKALELGRGVRLPL